MTSLYVIASDNGLRFLGTLNGHNQTWNYSLEGVSFNQADIKTKLLNLDKPCYIVRREQIGVPNEGYLSHANDGKTQQVEILSTLSPLSIEQLGGS